MFTRLSRDPFNKEETSKPTHKYDLTHKVKLYEPQDYLEQVMTEESLTISSHVIDALGKNLYMIYFDENQNQKKFRFRQVNLETFDTPAINDVPLPSIYDDNKFDVSFCGKYVLFRSQEKNQRGECELDLFKLNGFFRQFIGEGTKGFEPKPLVKFTSFELNQSLQQIYAISGTEIAFEVESLIDTDTKNSSMLIYFDFSMEAELQRGPNDQDSTVIIDFKQLNNAKSELVKVMKENKQQGEFEHAELKISNGILKALIFPKTPNRGLDKGVPVSQSQLRQFVFKTSPEDYQKTIELSNHAKQLISETLIVLNFDGLTNFVKIDQKSLNVTNYQILHYQNGLLLRQKHNQSQVEILQDTNGQMKDFKYLAQFDTLQDSNFTNAVLSADQDPSITILYADQENIAFYGQPLKRQSHIVLLSVYSLKLKEYIVREQVLLNTPLKNLDQTLRFLPQIQAFLGFRAQDDSALGPLCFQRYLMSGKMVVKSSLSSKFRNKYFKDFSDSDLSLCQHFFDTVEKRNIFKRYNQDIQIDEMIKITTRQSENYPSGGLNHGYLIVRNITNSEDNTQNQCCLGLHFDNKFTKLHNFESEQFKLSQRIFFKDTNGIIELVYLVNKDLMLLSIDTFNQVKIRKLAELPEKTQTKFRTLCQPPICIKITQESEEDVNDSIQQNEVNGNLQNSQSLNKSQNVSQDSISLKKKNTLTQSFVKKEITFAQHLEMNQVSIAYINRGSIICNELLHMTEEHKNDYLLEQNQKTLNPINQNEEEFSQSEEPPKRTLFKHLFFSNEYYFGVDKEFTYGEVYSAQTFERLYQINGELQKTTLVGTVIAYSAYDCFQAVNLHNISQRVENSAFPQNIQYGEKLGDLVVSTCPKTQAITIRIVKPDEIVDIAIYRDQFTSKYQHSALTIFSHVDPYAEIIDIHDDEGQANFDFDMEQNSCGFLNIHYSHEDYKEILECQIQSTQELIQSFKKKIPKSYLTYYYGLGSFFHQIALKNQVLEELFKTLQLMNKDNIPILFFKHPVTAKTPLDIAIEANATKAIQVQVYMIEKFQDKIIFNYIIDPHLCYLIEKNIDMKEYFEDPISISLIKHDDFEAFHTQDKIAISNIEVQDPREVLSYGKQLVDSSEKSSGQKISVEYYLVNLPETLTKDPKQLMRTLSQSDNIELFDNFVIQTIIRYKWQTYTRSFFKFQFLLFVLFELLYVTDLIYSLYYKVINDDNEVILDERNVAVTLSLKISALLLLGYFVNYEIKSAFLQTGYFDDPWNYMDFSLIILYVPVVIFDFLNLWYIPLTIAQCMIVILSFQKINFFLRIYEGFSFLVSMMASVFRDVKYFIAFFVIILTEFGILFTILFQAKYLEQYKGLGPFNYLMMSFRLSTGDFELDDYKDQDSKMIVVTWIVWILAVFVLNLTFMNFIIAVISESYEKVMEKIVAESYKVKADMIAEREIHMDLDNPENLKFFPKFLVMRRPQQLDQDGEEWQGFIKDLKRSIKANQMRNRNQLTLKINHVTDELKKKFDGVNGYIDSQNEDLTKRLSELQTQIQEKL